MEKKKYDLAVAYRIYPLISKTPAIFADDKYKLSELCLKSFKESLGSLKVKMLALLDNCPDEYVKLFRKYFHDEDLEIVRLDKAGNAKTFRMQVDLLLEQNYSEIVYFAEDDYVYMPGAFHEIIDFMNENKDVDFVSAYDHADYYNTELHNYKSAVKYSSNRHWRSVGTTCLTFLTTKKALLKNKRIFYSYCHKNYDSSLWLSITKKKIFNPLFYLKSPFISMEYCKILVKAWLFGTFRIIFGKKNTLWTPMPSIATHLEEKYLSPVIPWKNVFDSYVINMQEVK